VPLEPKCGALFAWLAAAVFCAGCGAKTFAVGSVAFPPGKPVFIDSSRAPRAELPDSPEPYRLILLDHAWCPPCADVWKAIRDASREIPAGSVHVYRVLFDRERLLDPEGAKEAAPLRPPPPADAGALPETTVIALPGAFRERFAPSQTPLLLLTNREGKVLRRWVGASPSLSAAIVSEVKRVWSSPPPPET
jgi:hypothetical protein